MSTRTMYIYLTAAWREAARARDPYIDVDHLLIGLLSAGGPAARLLTRHGLELPSARRAASAVQADSLAMIGVDALALPVPAPRAISDLHQDHVGRLPMSERAKHLVDRLGLRHASDRDLLRALLVEPSGTVHKLIESCGADPAALMREVERPADWTTPTPRRSRTVEARGAQRTVAVELGHFVPADPRLVRSVAADLSLAPQWLMLPDMTRQEDDRTLAMTWTKRGRTSTLRLALLKDEEEQVRWSEWWDDRPGGWFDLRLARVDGGTMLSFARVSRPIGVLGAALAPWMRLTNGLGLLVRAQNLSFACADALDEQRR